MMLPSDVPFGSISTTESGQNWSASRSGLRPLSIASDWMNIQHIHIPRQLFHSNRFSEQAPEQYEGYFRFQEGTQKGRVYNWFPMYG